ncbi:MAG: ABC transporter ATP-binding protein [Clostridia bacterium]|nr:ABC transporter ATP-binding protein [Clostridia bacterium]
MLEIKDLSKSYDGKEVIKNLTLTFPVSGIIALCGASGHGKSTLLSLITGLQKADSGSIEHGNNVISMSFQEPRLIPSLTAAENVNLVLGGKKTTLREAEALLNELGISDIHAYPDELSGGMKARVSVARALAFKADIYLFDEPFANLDKETAELTASVIKAHTECSLVLAVMHDVDFARELADRVIIFDETPISSARVI